MEVSFSAIYVRVARISCLKVGQYIQSRGSCEPAADFVLSRSRFTRQLCSRRFLLMCVERTEQNCNAIVAMWLGIEPSTEDERF